MNRVFSVTHFLHVFLHALPTFVQRCLEGAGHGRALHSDALSPPRPLQGFPSPHVRRPLQGLPVWPLPSRPPWPPCCPGDEGAAPVKLCGRRAERYEQRPSDLPRLLHGEGHDGDERRYVAGRAELWLRDGHGYAVPEDRVRAHAPCGDGHECCHAHHCPRTGQRQPSVQVGLQQWYQWRFWTASSSTHTRHPSALRRTLRLPQQRHSEEAPC